MEARGRSRISDDPGFGNTLPIPPLPAWVAGRFYTSYALIGAPGTTVADNGCYFIPILVPNDVIVTSLGLEVTSAGTAGALMRLGLYTSAAVTYLPETRLVDSGTLAGDAVAFAYATISQYLRPGHYWAAASYYTPTTYPTVRSLVATAAHIAFSAATRAAIAQVYQPVLKISTSSTLWAQDGLPRTIFPVSADSSDQATQFVTGTSKIPRILLGV